MSWDLTGNANTDESINFLGTTDNHALVIRTNNIEALRVSLGGSVGHGKVGGNVGIGTASPSEHLTVGGGAQADTKIEVNAGGDQYAALRIKNSQGSWNWQVAPSTDSPGGRLRLADETSGREWLSIAHTGNVGIGKTSPENQLHVGPGSSSIAVSRVNVVVASNNPDAGIAIAQNSGVNVLLQASTGGGYLGTTSGHSLTLRTNDQDRITIDANGDTTFNGALTMGSGKDIILSDVAEDFDIADVQVEPGTVMAIDQHGRLQPSSFPYDKRVAGVVSGAGEYRPAIVLGKQAQTCNRRSIALVGKAYCKVVGDSSPIEVGDLLTTSSTPGHAMKASDQFKAFGAVVGKALRSWRGGCGLIPILIALQ